MEKLVPVTVMMKLPLPGVADDGESEVTVGPVGAAMVKDSAPEVPVFGVDTVTFAVPAVVIRLAAMLAVN